MAARDSRLLGTEEYTGYSLLIIAAGLGVGGWELWYFHHGEISAIVMQVSHLQMMFIHFFTGRFDAADRQVLAANPDRVTFAQIVHLTREIGRFFLLPAMGFVFLQAALCVRRAAPGRYVRKLDLDGLIKEQAKSFRSAAAFVDRRLASVDVRKGEPRPADAALHVNEWIAAWAMENNAFSERKAREELARQLGDPWRGAFFAKPHVRCMLAVIALHHAQKRAEAVRLLGDLSQSLAARQGEPAAGPDAPLHFPAGAVSTADDVLKQIDIAAPVTHIMGRHFFTTPGLMSALTAARLKGGVLAPGQFAFLKLVDRRLWYALHSLGFGAEGRSPHPHPAQRIEAIGARDHWAAERIAGAPLSAPATDRAVAVTAAATPQEAQTGCTSKCSIIPISSCSTRWQ